MRIAGRAWVATCLAGLGIAICASPAPAAASSFTSWQLGGDGKQCSAPPDCGDGGLATAARFSFPQGVVVGPDGALYVADWGDSEIRRISIDGAVNIVAGGGTFCSTAPSCGDGGPATDAHLSFPAGVAVNQRTGDLYIADTYDNEIRRVSPRGTITRLAGTGTPCSTPRSCGDGGPAAAARLNSPGGVALDEHGDVYIADTGDQAVRMVSTNGTITRVAGTGSPCRKAGPCGDGGAAVSAQLLSPQGVAVDRSGGVYIADSGDNKVRKVLADGVITTLAGTGSLCSSPPSCGDGASAKQAQLSFPNGVALDSAGDLYMSDQGDNEVREVSSAGVISRVGGTGVECAKPPSCGDGGAGTTASFSYPAGVATDPEGDVYVGDTLSHELRWLSSPRLPPARIQIAGGRVAFLAFRADVSRSAVVVHATLGASAKLVLEVTGGGRRRAVVASAGGHTGFNALHWNRRFGSSPAPSGRYRLTLTARIGSASASSLLTARL